MTREDGSSGSAHVRLDFWQDQRAYRPWCDAVHVSGRHEKAATDQRLGRPAVFRGPVEVRAPQGHRVEERAQPGSVRLTPREPSVLEGGSSYPNLSGIRSTPASQGAMSGLVINKEVLDYDEEVPVHGVQLVAVDKATTSRRAVQRDHLSCRHQDLAGNLLKGEVSGETGLVGAGFGGKVVVSQNTKNVDVAIQVEVGDGAQAGKLEGSQSATDAVSGKSEVGQAKYVPGVNNDVADALSRFQWQRFRGLAPGADVLKTAVPRELWELGE
ncbi:hypothetical protein NDU88_003239 [Pleurodeles waltl]|uniref:Uncharacterized protein n=1 Tax=Pleurodeles waltl TaxID=8319 RepID=A0AAV7M4M9_PLEWA|nr:hypothetical protein NDU88_003239 [Pleurodeles waltl]